MKNKVLIKVLVCGIIVLFVGMGVRLVLSVDIGTTSDGEEVCTTNSVELNGSVVQVFYEDGRGFNKWDLNENVNSKSGSKESSDTQDISIKSTLSFNRGNILYVGGMGPHNYSKIQDAIDNATAGDIIYVYSGTYIEILIINKNLTLKGEDRNNVIIDGAANGNCISISNVWVSIANLTLRNVSGSGIYVDGCDLMLDGMTIRDCGRWGIYGGSYPGALIVNNCTIEDNHGGGIHWGTLGWYGWTHEYGTADVLVTNSVLRNNTGDDSITLLLLPGRNATIMNTTMENNTGRGVACGIDEPGGRATLEHITITNSGGDSSGNGVDISGVKNGVLSDISINTVRGSGLTLGSCSNMTIPSSVTIQNASQNGLVLTSCFNITILPSFAIQNTGGSGLVLTSCSNIALPSSLDIQNTGQHGIWLISCSNLTIPSSLTIHNAGGSGLVLTYCSNMTIPSSLIIQNTGGNGLILSSCSDLTIMSFNMYNISGSGIYVDGCDLTLDGMTIRGCGDWGIYGGVSPGALIVNNCTIEDNHGGIHWGTDDYYIHHKVATADVLVTNTVLRNNPYGGIGLLVLPGRNVTITNTTIENAGGGIGCVFDEPGGKVILKNNIVSDCSGYGIYLSGTNDGLIAFNKVTNNNNGIYLSSCNYNSIANNTINSNTGGGIYLVGSSLNSIMNNIISNNHNGISLDSSNNNEIYLNNFINNTVNGISLFSSNLWNSPQPFLYSYNESEYTNYLGNYWNNYNGSDMNGDGIGDSPYNVGGESDYYPLMRPFETYIWNPSTTESVMNETTSTTHGLFETIVSQNATAIASFTGDFNGTMNFTSFKLVLVNSGSFGGKGFYRGNWSASIESVLREGYSQGFAFKMPGERKIYLKGEVGGDMTGVVDGYLNESVNGSGVYDHYQANWQINRIGSDLVFAQMEVNGTLCYQDSSNYSSELYVLQSLLEGVASGAYNRSLCITITHVRINNETNPYYGEGFSIISYVTEFGSGGRMGL